MATNTFTHVLGNNMVLLMEVADAAGAYTGSYLPVAGAKSHSLSFGGDMIEVVSKSHNGKSRGYGLPDWSGSADALVSFDAGICNLKSLLQAKKDKKNIKIISLVVDPTNAPLDDDTAVLTAGLTDATFLAGSFYIIGEAIIDTVDISSGENEPVTFSISFSAAGDYTITDVPAAT